MRAANLIPEEQRGGSANLVGRSQGAALIVIAVLAGLVILAGFYGYARHQVSSKKAEVAQLQAEAQEVQSEVNRLAPYTKFVALREERMKDVMSLVNSRFDWAHALHELGRVLPLDASLSSVQGQIGSGGPAGSAAAATPAAPSAGAGAAATVTSATPPGSTPTFTLAGCATTQSEVALTLTRLRLIDGVSNVTLQSSTKGGSSGGAVSSGSGSCSGTAFTAEVTFDALPAVSGPVSPSSATATVADVHSGGTR